MRSERCEFRVTKEEKKFLNDKAEYLNISRTDLIIKSVKNSVIIHVDTHDIKKLYEAINKIGSNVNQIAHNANARGLLYEDVVQLQSAVEELSNLVFDKVLGVDS